MSASVRTFADNNPCGRFAGPAGGARAPQMKACSACAGDYEDPERSARTASRSDDLEDGEILYEVPARIRASPEQNESHSGTADELVSRGHTDDEFPA